MAESGAHCTRWASPLGYMLLALVAAAAADQLLPLSDWPPSPWNLLGAAPLASGLALALFAESQFRRAGTAVNPYARASALVTGGAFSVSRNPMYLGVVLVLLGAALLLASVPALLVAPAYAALVRSRFILPEEAKLAAQFGDAYSAYRSATRRWF